MRHDIKSTMGHPKCNALYTYIYVYGLAYMEGIRIMRLFPTSVALSFAYSIHSFASLELAMSSFLDILFSPSSSSSSSLFFLFFLLHVCLSATAVLFKEQPVYELDYGCYPLSLSPPFLSILYSGRLDYEQTDARHCRLTDLSDVSIESPIKKNSREGCRPSTLALLPWHAVSLVD